VAVDFHAMKKLEPQPTIFKYPKYFGQLGRLVESVERYFRVLLVLLSAQFLSLCIPNSDFALLSHFFLQKKMRFTYLFGIAIWFWAVDDLGYKANVSQENWVLCHVLRHFSIFLIKNTVHLKQNI
jgi:hypothetical protein